MSFIPNSFYRAVWILLTAISFQACNITSTTYRFAYKDEGSNKQLLETMKSILEEEFYNVTIELEEVDQPIEELDRLGSGELDFLLHENYSPYDKEGITSAFLAYPKFLHVFYREADAEPTSFGELIKGEKIYLEHPNSAEKLILNDLADFYNLTEEDFEITAEMAESDVVIDMSSILTPDYLRRLEGFKLFSFDDVAKFGQGSQIEGISLKLHRLQPYIIPEGTYGEFTMNAKLSVEIDMVMLANEEIGVVAVNDLIKTVLRHKQSFVSIDPTLFIGLDEQFDRSRLSYPLHDGARAYLDREEPSFFERYAELVGVVFSIMVALVTGLISFSKSRIQRKKDRVDVFYKELMDIKNESINSVDKVKIRIEQIKRSQNKAFDMLINEELSANESFRIYMELSKETITELRVKRKMIKMALAKKSAKA